MSFSPCYSQHVDLTAGVNPSGGADAEVYGAVPGNPEDPHTQWVLVTNSDNSVRYFSLSFLLFPSTCLFQGGLVTQEY